MQIDFNCDMGESFGPYSFGADEELMRHISSANVAGGFHAGDPHVMRETVALAREHGVAVGLHNGYGDLVGFGRREIKAAPEELRDELIYQLGALREFARLYGLEVQHVKPHGALYMAAARDEELSRAIIGAIQESDPALVLYCMQSSKTHEIALAEVNQGDGPARREGVLRRPRVQRRRPDRLYSSRRRGARSGGGGRESPPGRDGGQGQDRGR